MNFSHFCVAEPPTSFFTVKNTGAVGSPSTTPYKVHEDISGNILCDPKADVMRHWKNTLHNVTKITFLWPESRGMEFTQDCLTHLFRVEGPSNIMRFGEDLVTRVQVRTDIEFHRTPKAKHFDKKLWFSLSVIVNVLTIDWPGLR